MIALSPEGIFEGVRINNRSCGAITGGPYDQMPAYYAAYNHLIEITRRPELTKQFGLTPRALFVVDNTRVLHDRTSFDATGSRWFQGAYTDKDGLRSAIRILEQND